MNKRMAALIVGLMAFPCLSYAEETIFQKITYINYHGTADALYFRGTAPWAPPSCPAATYVQVRSTVPGHEKLLSIGLAAKMADKKVQFWGECDTNKNYFNAFYIVIE